jgi:tetratricopeptide (TPR) repeat protein
VSYRTSALMQLAALVLGACGGGDKADPGPPPDIKLEQASKAGGQALAMGVPSVAVREYKAALTRAYERDDVNAIADNAYNLGLAQMRSGNSKEAIATVRQAETELGRRRVPVPAELSLVLAAASYRAGDLTAAAAAAQQAIGRSASDPDTASRSWFIRGLVAADQSDGAMLAQAIAALKPSKNADLEADRQELLGRAALLRGQADGAIAEFERSAAYRQQALDYRGMTRSLAFAGEAAVRADRRGEAAVYYLRAGRSALLQGDTAGSAPLLTRSAELAKQTGQDSIVDEIARLRREAKSNT